MRLSAALTDQVVRNSANGSHYRMESMERDRAKIRPLELFPNGMLIPKPTPTTVEGSIEVVVIGMWEDGMIVEGKPCRGRPAYERELLKAERDLQELLDQYELLPRAGKGEMSRGSHANKIRAKRIRIDALRRGLGLAGRPAIVAKAPSDDAWPRERSVVQLPSGLPAVVTALRPVGNAVYATCRTRLRGTLLDVEAPSDALRPLQMASICDW